MSHQPRTSKSGEGWLWASAAALAGTVLLSTAGVFDRPAMAEMTAAVGGYTAMTTDGGTDEVLVITDNRTESLLAYQVVSGKRFELLAKHSLPELFRTARVQFTLP